MYYQRGFSVLESIIGLTVLISLLGLSAGHLKEQCDIALHQATAQQLLSVTQAASAYVQAHYDEYKKTNTASVSWSSLPLQTLQQQLYWPPQLARVDSNVYGQQYQCYVIGDNVPNSPLSLLIFTYDGQTIPERSLRQITTLMGGAGGYISILDDEAITGTQQGWRLLPPSSAAPDIAVGHLATLSLIEANQSGGIKVAEYLHRSADVDHPEFNQMETSLLMQDHRILYQEGQYQGQLSSKQLRLEDATHSLELSIPATAQLQLSAGSAQLKLQSNSLSFVKGSGNNSRLVAPTQLDPTWNKAPYYELPAHYSDGQVAAFASDQCERSSESLGRLLLVGRANQAEAQLFVCGQLVANNNGPNTGPAYAIAKAGKGHDRR